MTFRRSAPAALIAVIIIVVGGITFFSHRLFSGLTDSVEEGQFILMQSIVDTAMRSAADEALARADIVAALPATKQAVAARDRDRLLADYAEMFAVQRERRGVDQAQFHIPPAQSLLRLHAPSRFGDDLSKFRPMVSVVNSERAPRNGFALAASGPAIFGVSPVADTQGRHAGSFEFGLDFGPLLDRLKAAYNLDFTLFIDEKKLREFATGVNPAVLSDQNRVGSFIRYHTTNGGLMKELAGDADISAVNEPARYVRDAQRTPYGVLLISLRDNAGDQIGVLAAARDFGGSRAAAARSLVVQIAIAVFAIVILAGAVIVVIRGLLLRPLDVLNRRLDAIAAGERAEAIDGTEKFGPEILALADRFERLRTQGTRA